jgi:hypothetical protein
LTILNDTEQKILYYAIDEILWKEWDPIGVNDIENARDEYTNYTLDIVRLKINGSNKETIAKYLFKIETTEMGLSGDIEHCSVIADKILNV